MKKNEISGSKFYNSERLSRNAKNCERDNINDSNISSEEIKRAEKST